MSRAHCPGRAVEGGSWIACLLILVFGIAGCDDPRAQGRDATPVGGAGTGFDGVFHASLDGNRSVINLSERDGRVWGMIGAAAIAARSDGNRATGELTDPGSGVVVGGVEMSLDAHRLVVSVSVANPETGQRHAMPAVTYVRGTPPPIDVRLDARIVGRWKLTMLSPEGDDAPAMTTWLILSPDGSVQQGRASAADGVGALLTMSGSTDDRFSGRWRTDERMLHVLPAGKSQWIAFARYSVDADALRLTYNNGSRQDFRRPSRPEVASRLRSGGQLDAFCIQSGVARRACRSTSVEPVSGRIDFVLSRLILSASLRSRYAPREPLRALRGVFVCSVPPQGFE